MSPCFYFFYIIGKQTVSKLACIKAVHSRLERAVNLCHIQWELIQIKGVTVRCSEEDIKLKFKEMIE